MAYNNANLMSGSAKAKRVPGTVASAIKVGNLMILASSKADNASSMADAGTKLQNQAAAASVFLGVSLDAKLANDTRDILIASSGEFKFGCAALGQAYDIGTMVSFAGTGAGSAVGVSDTLVEVISASYPGAAIGKLSKNAASGDTTVYVELAAQVPQPTSGVQAKGAQS